MLERFLDAFWSERGVSQNTLDAYHSDLVALCAWLAGHGKSLDSAGQGDLLAYVAERFRIGSKPSSAARLLSGMRRFYRYLLREGLIAIDPTVQIESPRQQRAPSGINAGAQQRDQSCSSDDNLRLHERAAASAVAWEPQPC